MTTGITFDTREAAVEYRDRKHTEGYTADISYDIMTGKYRVTVGAGMVVPPEEEFPETPVELIEEEEEDEEETAEESRRREEIRKAAIKTVKAEIKVGREFTGGILGHTGRAISVKGGMKRAIPTLRGRHPRIGVEGAIGANTGKMPRIMVIPKAPGTGKMPKPPGIPYLKTGKRKKEKE